ncbi:T-cell surface glycoprotein CD8 beta chain-like [Mustelus asterias]
MRPPLFLVLLQSYADCSHLILQPARSQPVRLGDTVTLSCFVKSRAIYDYTNVYWLKQQGEQPPSILAYSFINSKQVFISEEISRSSSIKMSLDHQSLNLTIERVDVSDAGHYYCAGWRHGILAFGNGTTLKLAGLEDSSIAPSPTSISECPLCPSTSSCWPCLLLLAGVSLLALAGCVWQLGKDSSPGTGSDFNQGGAGMPAGRECRRGGNVGVAGSDFNQDGNAGGTGTGMLAGLGAILNR